MAEERLIARQHTMFPISPHPKMAALTAQSNERVHAGGDHDARGYGFDPPPRQLMLSFGISLIWLLAMLGAAAYARDADRKFAPGIVTAIAFVFALGAASGLSPQPNWIAVLIGGIAIWRLIAGPSQRAGPAFAGASAGMATALAIAGGVSPWLATALTAGALAAGFAMRGARRSDGHRRDALLILVALVVPLIGLAGDIVFGWHSAAMLNREAVAATMPAPPGWAIGIVAVALIAGLVRGAWIRR